MTFEKTDSRINISTPERCISGTIGIALALFGLKGFFKTNWRGKRKVSLPTIPKGLAILTGGYLIQRGITGRSQTYRLLKINTADISKTGKAPQASVRHGEGVKIERSVIINSTREELFRFWRNFENLPRFMNHLEAVTVLDHNQSHWVTKGPAGTTVEWDAVIHNEIPNELIAWRSVGDTDVPNAGSVLFEPIAEGRGTHVKVVINYDPPAGRLGSSIAKLFGEEPGLQVEEDLRRFKHLMESRPASEISGTLRFMEDLVKNKK